MADIGTLAYAVVVSYTDGSAVLGCYGPYETYAKAEAAMAKIRGLPGMDAGNHWEVRELWQIADLMKAGAGRDQG